MRLLILSHNYAPEATGIGPYTTDLSEYFASSGHSVTVLTTFPHYPWYRWQGKPGIRARERRAGVDVRRMRVALPRQPTAASRIVFDSSVGFASIVNSVGLARPNLIIGVIPTLQNGFSACLLARLWRVPAVLLVKDLPLETALAVGLLKRGWILRVGRHFERVVYRMADRVVVIGDQFRRSLIAKGVNPGSIEIIPDWVDTERIKPEPADPEIHRRLAGSADGFLVVYAGTMGAKQGLRNVIDASKELVDDSRIRMALVGDGPTRSSLEAAISDASLENVRMLGIQPAEDFPKILAAADVLLLNQRADVVDAVVPSKLLSYMAAGRPVIASVNEASIAARLIKEAGCGIVVPPENPTALARGIRELQHSPHRRATLACQGRDYAERRFARAAILERWEMFTAELVTLNRRAV